jgi:hypothetical protein
MTQHDDAHRTTARYAGGSYLTTEHETLGMIAARFGGDRMAWEMANPWVTDTTMPLPAGLRVAIPVDQPAATPPPADRADFHTLVRRAICEADGFDFDDDSIAFDDYAVHADAVLAVLPTTDRAAVLRELEQRYREHAHNSVHPDFSAAYAAVANDLSRMADEAQPAQPHTGETAGGGV